MEQYPLTVIGGGPGGYTAALRAAALGLKTLLIEKENLGGTCLNHGCIPTKTLTYSALLLKKLKEAGEYGLTAGEVGFSYPKVQEKKGAVVEHLVSGVRRLLKDAGVEVVQGQARLLSPREVEVITPSGETRRLQAEKLILAPGSREYLPPVAGIQLPGILTSREALALREVPPSLAILGGGVIAVEMASIFSAFGSSVTIVQRSRILRREDTEMVRRLTPFLRKQGIKILTETKLLEISPASPGFSLKVEGRRGEETLTCHSLLVAVGREAAHQGLNLEEAGIECTPAGIPVSETMETNVPGVYAVGDAALPGYYLAHVASHQGVVAAERAAGLASTFEGDVIPICIFTQPELSRVGLTEEEALERGLKIKIGKFPFTASGKAYLQGEAEGMVKIIANQEDDKVLGLHILGPHASDLIQEGSLAIKAGCRSRDLAHLIHPHPTLSEALWEAALAVDGSPIHFTGR